MAAGLVNWRLRQARSDKLEGVVVRPAANLADLRAAAAVRAACFYTYPKDRSEMSTRTHRKMKLDQEWNALQRKMNNVEPGYNMVKVTCLMAVAPVPADLDDEARWLEDVDRSCKLPADEASGTPAMMCIGSLDINECERFPSEDVQPKQVNSGDDGRAFLSNVCTGPGVRRQGIAKQLVEASAAICKEKAIKQLYVHVVPSNEAAHDLYIDGCGFQVEVKENANEAYIRDRERRFLLRRDVI